MEGNRHWLGWIAIGLGAVALVVALLGRGFGPQMSNAAGRPGAFAQQQQAQPQADPGANAQPGVGQQAQPQNGPRAGRQQEQGGKPGAGAQGGVAGPGGEARRGGRPDGGFGIGGWLHLPFRLIGGSFQWVMLALLIGLGVWMMRGRNTAAASTSEQAAPAQAPLSPTGEAYVEDPSEE